MNISSGPERLRLSVPASVILFGEYQDEIGLETIHLAGGPRLTITAIARKDRMLYLAFGSEPLRPVLDLDEIAPPTSATNKPAGTAELCRVLLQTALQDAATRGLRLRYGCDIFLDDPLPRTLTFGRTAALAVAWAVFLLWGAGRLTRESGLEIAALAQRLEASAMGRSCAPGRTLACALGGLLLVAQASGRDKPPPTAPLRQIESAFLLAELAASDATHPRTSECRPATAPRPTSLRQTYTEAMNALRRYFPHFDPRMSPAEEVIPFLGDLPDRQAQTLYALLNNRDICRKALTILSHSGVEDADVLGELLDQHHEMLRDHLGLVSPEQETLVHVAHAAGALGAKANTLEGSSVLIFAPGRLDEVRAALEGCGAKIYAFDPEEGMSLESDSSLNDSEARGEKKD